MHETRDASAAGIALSGAGLAVFLILVALMPMLLTRKQPRVERFTLPPQPRLQADSIDELARIRAAELKRLESSGPDHIPIERAMQLVAQQGVPVRGGK